jgi:hypothetical protein
VLPATKYSMFVKATLHGPSVTFVQSEAESWRSAQIELYQLNRLAADMLIE